MPQLCDLKAPVLGVGEEEELRAQLGAVEAGGAVACWAWCRVRALGVGQWQWCCAGASRGALWRPASKHSCRALCCAACGVHAHSRTRPCVATAAGACMPALVCAAGWRALAPRAQHRRRHSTHGPSCVPVDDVTVGRTVGKRAPACPRWHRDLRITRTLSTSCSASDVQPSQLAASAPARHCRCRFSCAPDAAARMANVPAKLDRTAPQQPQVRSRPAHVACACLVRRDAWERARRGVQAHLASRSRRPASQSCSARAPAPAGAAAVGHAGGHRPGI
jgi:hypothetical protein